LTDNPISASVMKKGAEKTQSAFNTAALRLIGEQGDAALPEVLARADDRIGAVMDGIAKNNRIKVDDRMVSELAALEEAASMTLEPAQIAPLRNQLNNILSKVDDQDRISGEAYQRIRTIAADMGRNPALAGVSKQLRETIDSALERSAGPEAAAAIKQARKQYRNLKLLEPAVAANATGNISPAALASSTGTARQRGAALYGRGDADMARLARDMRTMAETMPQSGTAPRGMIQAYGQALAPAAAGVGYGVVSGETPSDQAQTALALGALGLMAPRGAARLYQSPAFQQYLMRGIQSPLIRGTMLSPVTRGISTYAPAAGLLSSQD
jgi:DNA-binding GntR family transcriptional regulator